MPTSGSDEGLRRGGIDPSSFPFEAGRRPYPGFASLQEKEAAIFFGRDAQIVRGLDKIRSLVRAGVDHMLVILGASGSGKSSFFRAGLWPRLKRDDRTWLPLPIIRPERAVISGKYGLVQAMQQVMSNTQFANGIRKRDLPRSRAEIQDFIEKTEDPNLLAPGITSEKDHVLSLLRVVSARLKLKCASNSDDHSHAGLALWDASDPGVFVDLRVRTVIRPIIATEGPTAFLIDGRPICS